ncbi:MAG: GerAB/ArcD/ProY family transporter [Clostridiaceae bacterium]|nr:GerAB/ArcD/ProY family transporter [Clostridiaceae bacterium]HPU45588.1 GerAB/ArcD/ProY family transporter [Thermoclostridium sp.]
MKKKTIFGNWEASAIIINLICTKIFLNYPRLAAEQGGTAAWIFTIYISVLALVGFTVIQALYKPFEGKDLLDVAELAAGNPGRIIVGLVIIFSAGWCATAYMRVFSENIKLIALTTSPLSFVELFFIVCLVVGAYLGTEALSRLHAFSVSFIASGYLLIMVGVVNYIDFGNLLPILGNGVNEIFINGAPRVSVFFEMLFLFLLTPFLKRHGNMKATGYWSLGFSIFFLVLSALVYTSVFPYPSSLERTIPIFHIARLIKLGRFFQRMESVFLFIWAAAALLYISVCFYFILFAFQKAFQLDYYKPLIIPFAIIIMAVSFIPTDFTEVIIYEVNIFRNWSWIVAFVMPILLLIIARLKKKKPARKGQAA